MNKATNILWNCLGLEIIVDKINNGYSFRSITIIVFVMIFLFVRTTFQDEFCSFSYFFSLPLNIESKKTCQEKALE